MLFKGILIHIYTVASVSGYFNIGIGSIGNIVCMPTESRNFQIWYNQQLKFISHSNNNIVCENLLLPTPEHNPQKESRDLAGIQLQCNT